MADCFTHVRGLTLGVCLFLANLTGAIAQTPDPSDTTYVRFNIQYGASALMIDVQMLSHEAPINVASFLSYVNGGTYNNSFIHRNTTVANSGVAVLQGGGFNFDSNGNAEAVVNSPPSVKGEPGFSNKRGTLALPLQSGEDTGSDGWYLNLIDNTALDTAFTNNGVVNGPFTVFGVVANANSLAAMDEVASTPTFNFGSPFATLPLVNFTTADFNAGTGVPFADFIYTTSYSVYTITSFSAWQAALTGNAATLNGPSDTPQGDSMPNLIKYALGISGNQTMTASDRLKLPAVGQTTSSGQVYMTMTYHQRQHMDVVSVGLAVQTSTDLVHWGTPSNATITQTGTDSDGNAVMLVKVPAPATGSQFMRLQVTQ